VICELCNNELRSISAFRKDLVIKQTNLYGFVEGYVEDETIKEYEQHEVYEHAGQVPAIKNERADNVEIKMEQTDTDDYSMFISTEYLETLQDDEGADEETYLEEEEFAFVKQEKRSGNVRTKGLKKHYKRFVKKFFNKRFD
jgi:hypothetical protein